MNTKQWAWIGWLGLAALVGAERCRAQQSANTRLPAPSALAVDDVDRPLNYSQPVRQAAHTDGPSIRRLPPVEGSPRIAQRPIDAPQIRRLPPVEPATEPTIKRLPPVVPNSIPATAKPSPESTGLDRIRPIYVADASERSTPVRAPAAKTVQPRAVRTNAAIAPTEMAAVSARADAQVRRGFVTAGRGAHYSARTDFIQALRLIAETLDTSRGGRTHAEALAAGLRALEEAEDFVPVGSRLEAELDLASIVAAHRTPVLKKAPTEQITSLVAQNRYLTYAQEQLALAAGRTQVGSLALYGLGKIHTALAAQGPEEKKVGEPKAMAFHQAAILADPHNALAANELGVLLARYGKNQTARAILTHSLSIAPRRETFHNLAVVEERLGNIEGARHARAQATALAETGNGPLAHPALASSPVRWVGPAEFARSKPTDHESYSPQSTPPATQTTQASSGTDWLTSWAPWLRR